MKSKIHIHTSLSSALSSSDSLPSDSTFFLAAARGDFFATVLVDFAALPRFLGGA